MDGGKIHIAKVASKDLEDHWLNLRMSIHLKDF